MATPAATRAATAAGELSQPGQQGPGPVNVGGLVISIFGGAVNLVLVLVFTFFLLLEGDRLAQGALLALPKERRIHVRNLGLSIRDNISRWVVAEGTYAAISAGSSRVECGRSSCRLPGCTVSLRGFSR